MLDSTCDVGVLARLLASTLAKTQSVLRLIGLGPWGALMEGAPGLFRMAWLAMRLCLRPTQPIAERAKATVAPKAAPPASAAVASGLPEV